MIYIQSNPDNPEYLIIDVKHGLASLLISENIPCEIKETAQDIYRKAFEFEEELLTYISEISIRKDSELGNYLLQTKDIEIINEDYEISYDKITNALNIALFENNPISNEILLLFRNRIEGYYEDLLNNYGKNVLDYILENFNFEKYLQKKDGIYINKEYVVYDNGNYSFDILRSEANIKNLKRNNTNGYKCK